MIDRITATATAIQPHVFRQPQPQPQLLFSTTAHIIRNLQKNYGIRKTRRSGV